MPYARAVPIVEGNVGNRRDCGTECGRQGGSQIVGTCIFCADSPIHIASPFAGKRGRVEVTKPHSSFLAVKPTPCALGSRQPHWDGPSCANDWIGTHTACAGSRPQFRR